MPLVEAKPTSTPLLLCEAHLCSCDVSLLADVSFLDVNFFLFDVCLSSWNDVALAPDVNSGFSMSADAHCMRPTSNPRCRRSFGDVSGHLHWNM